MNGCLWLLVLALGAPLTSLPPVLTLDDAVRLARAQHPQMQLSRQQTVLAHAQAMEARGPVLPQLLGTASYQRTTSNYVVRPGTLPTSVLASAASKSVAATDASYDYFNLGLSASQLVWDFYQTPGRWQAAEAVARAQDQNTNSTQFVVDYNVRNFFFAAYAAKANVKVGEETLANQQKHADQVAGYITVGARAEIDLAQAKTDVANAKVLLISAQNAYLTAKAQLNQAMGVEATLGYDLGGGAMAPVDHEDATDDSLVDEALAARPEVAAVRATEDARAQTLSAARGTWGPSLSLQAGITDVGVDLRTLTWNWQVGAVLNWPLLSGGTNWAQIDEAEAGVAIVRAQRDLLRQQVRLDVEQARVSVRNGKETLGAAGEALINARERLKYAEGRYETGVGSIIELGDAQVAVTSAAFQQVQAQYQLDSARAALLKALGRSG